MATFSERRGSPCAVIGALALHAYGLSRGTFDPDLAEPSAAQPGRLALLESLGYETLHRSAAGPGRAGHPDAAPGTLAWSRW